MKAMTPKMPRRPKIVLACIVFIGSWVFAQMGYVFFHQIQDVPADTNLFNFLKALVVDVFSNHVLLEVCLNGFILFSGIVILRQLVHRFRYYRKWRYFMKFHSIPLLEEQLNTLFDNEKARIRVISHPIAMAMAVGGWSPQIILTDALVAKFNQPELESIILHEMYHCKYRHPLQIFILSIVAQSLAFLPAIKNLVHYYKIWLELLADRFVIYRTGNELLLGSVLLALFKDSKGAEQAYGVNFANEAINYRLQQLIDPQAALKIPVIASKPLVLSLLVIIIMISIIVVNCV